MSTDTTSRMTGLTSEAAQRISRVATACIVIVGLTAAALSYEGLHRTGLAAGIDSRLAWGLPVIIDGTVMAGLLGVLTGTLSGTGTRFPWTLVLLGATASIAGNVAAAPATTVGRTVAVVAPVCLALSLEQGLRILRHRATLPAPRKRKQPPVVAARMTATAPAPRSASVSRLTGSATGPSPKPVTAPRISSRRAQVATLLAEDSSITGAAVAEATGLDPADARRHLRALRSEQQARPTLNLASAVGSA